MHELLGMTLVELAENLRARKASPVEVMEAVLARIDETHEDLNAVVALRDRDVLLRDARESWGEGPANSDSCSGGGATR